MDNNTPETNLQNTEEVTEPKAKEKKKKRKTPPKTSDLIKKMNRTLKIQTAWILILSLAVIGLAGYIFSDFFIYNTAKFYINKGNMEKGVELLKKIPDYSDVSTLLDDYKYTVRGNVIKLGSYEQDGDSSNGEEPLEWVVLDYDAEENKTLIITLYAIDSLVYEAKYGATTWETSDARKWLNRNFIKKAFTDSELEMIIESDIENTNNLRYKTKGGNVTTDKVFILSDAEFNKYLRGTDNAIGYTTQHARDKGVQSGSISGTSVYWLRTPGESLVYVSTVSYAGELNSLGVFTYSYSCGVRPCMWIKANN